MWHGMHDRHGRDCGPRGGGRWGGGFGWETGGERGRAGGRGRVFDGGELRLVLLKLIADEPRHGYDLIRTIEELTGGAYAPSPGVVYPTLTLLDEQGLIEEQQSEGAKKRFAATDAGRELLLANAEAVDVLMKRLALLGGERERVNGAPIQRAMANLAMAVKQRLGRGAFSDDTLHDVAALLDEVAQKIERLR